MKNFKSNLKQTVRAFPLLVVMLLCSSAVLAVPGWSNTNMTARQSTADELTDRQVSSAWQPTYQGYQSQIFEVGTTNVPSDYSEVSSGSSDEQGGHKGHIRRLGGGTDVGEQSELSPIGEPWIMLLFALLACGVIAYRRMNFRHNKNMKNTILNQLFSSCKKWKTLVLIGMLLTLGVGQMWADNAVTVYCAINASTMKSGDNCYTLKVNANIGDNNTWRQYTMNIVDKTKNGKLIYSATIYEKYGGVDALQFQLYQGSSWKAQKQPYSSWTKSSTFSGKLYDYDAGSWSAYSGLDDVITVYFVNNNSWGTPKAYAWSGCTNNAAWSGTAMTSTGKTYNGKDIYSISFNKRFENIIFSNNGSSQTADQTLGSTNAGKMYDNGTWRTYNYDVTITFNMKGHGDAPSDITVLKGNTATAPSTPSATGYTFGGWYTNSGCTTAWNWSTAVDDNKTLYAKWTPKTTTITLDNQGATDAGSTSVTATYDADMPAITLPTKTGYIFGGYWGAPDGSGPQYYNADGTSAQKWANTESTYKLFAKWTAITLSASISPTTINANTATAIQFTITTNAPLSSGYYFQITNWGGKNSGTAGGYNIDGDHLITTSSITHTLAAGLTNLDAGTYKIKLKITKDAVTQVESDLLTLTVSSSTYTVTVKAGTGGTVSLASISASPDSWSGDITATPNPGYRFVNWTSSGGGITINNNTSATTQVKATSTGGTLTANFAAATYRVTLDNQSATSAGTTYVDATYKTTTLTTIIKPTKTNYTFGGYYTATGGGGIQIIDANGNWLASKSGFTDGSKKSIITENKILYAKWTETKYAVTVAVDDASHAAGVIVCSAAGWEPSKSGTAQIGSLTNVTITVGASAAGYKFDGGYWTLTGGVTLVSGPLTNPSITVNATAAGSAIFTYAEDLSSTFFISGATSARSPFTGWGASGTPMFKKTGHSTEEIYYCTITVNNTAGDGEFEFKPYNSNGNVHYGHDNYWVTNENHENITCWGDNPYSLWFKPYVTGDYVFKIDNTGTYPVLTVTWPVINQLRISSASPTDATNTGDFDLVEGSSNNWSVTRTLNANTTYTFKMVYEGAWYGKNSTALTRASNTASSLSTSGADMTVKTDVAGSYTFTFNSSTKNLTVTYPTAYTITYGAGTHNGSSTAISVSPLFNSGDYVLPETDVTFTKGSTKTGYTWKGWYPAADGTGTAWSTSDANLTLTATRTGNINVYACYNLVNYTITYNLDGGTNPVSPAPPTSYTIESADIALPTPTKEGYVFAGWYSDAELTTPVSTIPTGSTGNKAFWAKWDQKGTYSIYYYNKDSWENVYAYIWDGGSSTYETAWPGERMFIHQGKVYKHDYELSSVSYDKVIFNNNDGTQTSNLDIADGASGNKWFYNPNDATVNAGGIHHGWSQYFMIADYPTTKQVAVVGEKITIDPVFSWAEGVDFDDINITANRDSGSTDVNAMVAGTKIIATATAAGTAKYTITYSYLTTTITKVIRFQFAAGITVQSKVPKTDEYWKNSQDVEGIHYWGTNLTSGDVKMTWLKADENYDYYQALVPLGTDNKTNFLFYFDSYSTEAWRKTLDVTDVTSDCCYTITLQNGNKDIIRKAELSGTGLCSDSYQVVITMGSGDIYTSNIVTSSDEIVSFFAPSNAKESKTYRQGTVTLEHNGLTVYTYPANTFSASGVYTAKINANYSLNSLALYTGDYYIRTDGAAGGWDNYKTNPANKMTQFNRNTNFPNESFSYYWVANVGHGLTQNIKGTVANDYNPVLCSFSPDETANEPDGINLRFGYEPTTNDLVRGIIGGSTTNNFLNIVCADGSLIYKDIDCTILLDETHYQSTPFDSKFQDKSNWVYEVIVYAKIDATHPVANVVLNSYYYGIHYLLGMVKDDQGRETSTPVSFPVIKTGTTEGIYGLRVVYDFKTNRLFAAWAPADRVIDGVLDVDADVMFLRHEDGDAAQISFKTNASRIEDIKQAIFALELDNEKADHGGTGNIERHYFISLPFDCKVSNIFGIGGFMNYWGIQRYNGAKRAQIGWFQETPTFWEWLSADDVMKAGEGYLLSVDKKALENGNVWKDGIIYQKQEVIINPSTGQPYKAQDGSDSIAWKTYSDGSMLTMYFPSTTSGFTITPATGEALTISYPDQPCSITRDDRDKKDSNWKCIGTPGYKNVEITKYSQASPELVVNAAPRFLYEFHEQTTGATWAKGTYTVTDGSAFTYHSFHSYMVQFAGTIDWAQYSKGDVAPSPIAPKRMPTADTKITKVEIELLSSDDDALDRTFVWLQENATIGFDQNYDLNKMIEKKANQIYSLAENEVPFAANVLPLGTDTVPLVVNIANEGEYTFSLNVDKHVGMAPILYDMYKSEQINLLTTNYAVELEKGKHEDRFFLLFQPEAPIVTNFETTADGGQNVHSSEAIYDVLGRRVNTIYPGHLYIVNGEKRIAK